MKRGTPDHPKMKALVRALQIPQPHAVGLMENLWHWCARFCPQGDIGKWSNQDIAAGAFWDGDPDVFVDALVSCRWLDMSRHVRLSIHDWEDHCDEAVKKYLKRKELKFVSTFLDKSGQILPAIAIASAVAQPKPEPLPPVSDISEIVERIVHRHPKKDGVTMGQSLLHGIIASAVDPIITLESIDRRHKLYCEEVNGRDSQYIKSLKTWVNEKCYLDPDPEPETDGYHSYEEVFGTGFQLNAKTEDS